MAIETLLWAAFLVVALAFVLVSLAPLVRSPLWWVRCWDFPRLQMAILGTVLTALSVWLAGGARGADWALPVLLGALTAGHFARVAPFTPLWPVRVARSGPVPPEQTVSVLLANVLQENRSPEALLDMIERRDPDIVFLTETDAFWADRMRPALARYPRTIVQDQENHYGLIFMTRLEVDAAEVLHFADPDEPLARIDMRFPDGAPLRFWGLHPEPPIPGRGTADRDADLTIVAEQIRTDAVTTLVGGDLNDVAWSHTTRLFLRLSGLLDPRIGRGLYPSFHADHVLARWPLDHLFVSHDLMLVDFAVEGHIGSDHFPIWAVIARTPEARRVNADPAQPDPGDAFEAEELKRRPEVASNPSSDT